MFSAVTFFCISLFRRFNLWRRSLLYDVKVDFRFMNESWLSFWPASDWVLWRCPLKCPLSWCVDCVLSNFINNFNKEPSPFTYSIKSKLHINNQYNRFLWPKPRTGLPNDRLSDVISVWPRFVMDGRTKLSAFFALDVNPSTLLLNDSAFPV